jgi:poly-beta-1,6-N-acetyl-D-glucosamine synthase
LASGDDDLLMHQFAKYDIQKVKYSQNFLNIIACRTSENWNDFLSQRKRWASKITHYLFPYNSWIHGLLIINLIGFYFAFWALFNGWQTWFLLFIILRIFIDLLLAIKLYKVFNFPLFLPLIMPLYLLYVFPLFIFSVISKTEWKGRDIIT